MSAESICAHVRYGENYLVTSKRKIREEFVGGIDRSIELKEITKDTLLYFHVSTRSYMQID